MDGIESGRKHFFFAGKCTNQAKPLLPRFSAVFCGVPRSYGDVAPRYENQTVQLPARTVKLDAPRRDPGE